MKPFGRGTVESCDHLRIVVVDVGVAVINNGVVSVATPMRK